MYQNLLVSWVFSLFINPHYVSPHLNPIILQSIGPMFLPRGTKGREGTPVSSWHVSVLGAGRGGNPSIPPGQDKMEYPLTKTGLGTPSDLSRTGWDTLPPGHRTAERALAMPLAVYLLRSRGMTLLYCLIFLNWKLCYQEIDLVTQAFCTDLQIWFWTGGRNITGNDQLSWIG